MATDLSLRILYIERLNGGVIIGFNDGKSAVYSADLLHSVLPQALIVPEENPTPEPESNVIPIA